ALPRRTGPAVEQPQHTFHNGQTSTAGAVPEQRSDELFPAQHRIEIAPRAVRGQPVVARVDVVGADFERRHPLPAVAQRRQQAGRDGRLALTGPRGGDHHPGIAHHSMPLCPFWPESIGCLTLVVSMTRSAASINSWGASRPVITTCWYPGRSRRTDSTSSTSTHPHRNG